MKAKYILNAVSVLDRAYAMIDKPDANRSPQEVGSLLAALFGARTDLEIYSGLREVEVSIEKDAA